MQVMSRIYKHGHCPSDLTMDNVEKIVDVKLNAEEKALFDKRVAAVRKTNGLLGDSLK